MRTRYRCRKTDNGVIKHIPLAYDVVIDAGLMRLVTIDGEEFKILGRSDEQPQTFQAKRPRSGVTKRSSLASGVHRDQVNEARDVAKKINSGIEFTPKGEVSFSDRRARRDWLRHCNLRDKDGGYGD